MPDSSTDLQKSLIASLHEEQPLRLWSFIVSIFGELAGSANHEISGALLGTLVAKIGSKPEALRVALHRLKKDGWIESIRHGRQSRYRLTEIAHNETLDAYPAIYSSQPQALNAWLIVSNNRSTKVDCATPSIPLSTNTWLSNEPVDSETTWSIALSGGVPIPQWVTEKICSPILMSRVNDLHRILETKTIQNGLIAVDQALLRVLIVHCWRRIILNQPQLPDYVFPIGWKGEKCRKLVLRHLGVIAPVELSKLEAEMTSRGLDSQTV